MNQSKVLTRLVKCVCVHVWESAAYPVWSHVVDLLALMHSLNEFEICCSEILTELKRFVGTFWAFVSTAFTCQSDIQESCQIQNWKCQKRTCDKKRKKKKKVRFDEGSENNAIFPLFCLFDVALATKHPPSVLSWTSSPLFFQLSFSFSSSSLYQCL